MIKFVGTNVEAPIGGCMEVGSVVITFVGTDVDAPEGS